MLNTSRHSEVLLNWACRPWSCRACSAQRSRSCRSKPGSSSGAFCGRAALWTPAAPPQTHTHTNPPPQKITVTHKWTVTAGIYIFVHKEKIIYSDINIYRTKKWHWRILLTFCVHMQLYCRRSHLSITATVSCCYGNIRPSRRALQQDSKGNCCLFLPD